MDALYSIPLGMIINKSSITNHKPRNSNREMNRRVAEEDLYNLFISNKLSLDQSLEIIGVVIEARIEYGIATAVSTKQSP